MPTKTPIAALPYPVLSDPPNGPDQIGQLALKVEPLLVNYFANATTRSSKLTSPAAGALSYRGDDNVYEYWNGTTKTWRGLNTTEVIDEYNAASQGALAFTTTESRALATSSATLRNNSKIYRMMYLAFMEFNVRWTSNKDGQRLYVRHKDQEGTSLGGARAYEFYTYGASGSFTGMYPVRTNYVAPSTSIVIKNWFTIQKAGGVAGTISLSGGGTDTRLVGITSVAA